MALPEYCDPDAYRLFCEQLPILETTTGLVRATTAISLHALSDARVELIEKQLADLAGKVRSRIRSQNTEALLAHLHQVLFDEEGFRGDTDDYYSTLNSFLPAVLERRRGLPVLLAVVYKAVAEQIGLSVEGVNAPGHFLVRVFGPDRSATLVDPFQDGRVLSPGEARAQSDAIAGPLDPRGDYLPAATHHLWVARILRNLERYFEQHGFTSDLFAMRELLAVLSA